MQQMNCSHTHKEKEGGLRQLEQPNQQQATVMRVRSMFSGVYYLVAAARFAWHDVRLSVDGGPMKLSTPRP
jgi:hypothetical protein